MVGPVALRKRRNGHSCDRQILRLVNAEVLQKNRQRTQSSYGANGKVSDQILLASVTLRPALRGLLLILI